MHRTYRVLANRLSRAGFAVMRFDHFGAGDSAGAASDATFEDWIEGVDVAARELTKRTSTSRLAVVGLRLGGTLAALAASRSAPRTQHLLLWDPVVDGAAYLRELAVAHAGYLTEEMGREIPLPPTSPEGFPTEALGHSLSHPQLEALARCDLSALASLGAEHVSVVTTSEPADVARLRARHAMARNVSFIPASTSVPWNSDAAVNDAVVPAEILDKLMARIEEVAA